jgi:putative membrane protein
VVELTTNDANSYLAGTIADTVTGTVRESLTQEVGETAAMTLLDSVATIRSGLVDAADGAQQLADGSATAKDGADTLASGANSAASGSEQLLAGLNTLNSSVEPLPGKVSELASGARQVADGNQQLNDQVAPAAQRIADAVAKLPTDQDVRDRLAELGVPEDQIEPIVQLIAPAGNDIRQANDDVQAAASAVAQLADGSRQVADGAQQLSDNMPALASGVASAASGASSLDDGIHQLDDGASSLADGLGDLKDGSATLASSLADAVQEIPDQSEEERTTAAKMMSDPVSVESGAISEASSYGAGMAPFFISLAAWIGIYALFLIVKPYSQRAVTALRKPLPITLGAWATPALLGVLQMGAVYLIVAFGLGYQVAHPAGMIGLMALASVTFAAIILTLNVLLGSVGQFLGLVLMVLQLVSAGGTFPFQTLPTPLRAMHEALPMSYAVDALRQLMYGGDMARVWQDVAFLGCWLVAALIIAFFAILRMTRSRTMRDIRPSLLG